MDESTGRELIHTAHALLRDFGKAPVATVAAVNALAFGGGCELAMACDVRIAAESAVFGQPEIKLGIIPGFGGTQRLPRLVGPSKALEMNLVGDAIPSDEALEFGLVNRVVPDHELFETALMWGRKLAAQAPVAVEQIKLVSHKGDLDEGIEAEKRGFATAFASEDAKEGIGAFLGKRTPKWSGQLALTGGARRGRGEPDVGFAAAGEDRFRSRPLEGRGAGAERPRLRAAGVDDLAAAGRRPRAHAAGCRPRLGAPPVARDEQGDDGDERRREPPDRDVSLAPVSRRSGVLARCQCPSTSGIGGTSSAGIPRPPPTFGRILGPDLWTAVRSGAGRSLGRVYGESNRGSVRSLGEVVLPGFRQAQTKKGNTRSMEWLSEGANSWQLTAATFVGLMSVPGLMVLYGGVMQKRWSVNSMMMAFVAFAIVLVLWCLFAFKMGFGSPIHIASGGFFGNLVGKPGSILSSHSLLGQAHLPELPEVKFIFPESTLAYFQIVFAAITPLLMLGSVLGRINFKAWIPFVALWTVLVYTINAFLIWGGGFFAQHGAVDFSGGYVIHLAAGVSGFVAAAVIGPRLQRDREVDAPNNLAMVAVGAGLLWLGWNGFNGGDWYGANGIASARGAQHQPLHRGRPPGLGRLGLHDRAQAEPDRQRQRDDRRPRRRSPPRPASSTAGGRS